MNIPKISLDDVCESKISTLSSLYNGIIEYIDISSIDNVEKKVSSTQLMDAKIAPSRAKQLVQSGDILVSTVRPNLNAVAIINQESTHLLVASTGYCILRCNKEINSRYVFYFCQSSYFIDQMTLQATGASYPAVTSSIVKKTLIPFYSIEKQNYIVSVLDKLTTLISLRKQQLAKLDELVKARFVEMFGEPGNNSLGLPTLPMTEVCTIIDGDRGKNYPKQEDFSEKGYCLFLNAKNVTSTGFLFESCIFITKEKDCILNNGKLTRGDIVLTTRGTLGNLAFYDNSIPYENIRINSGMVILRMKRKIVSEIFFIEQFKMQLQTIKKQIASGSAQPQLPVSAMNKIRVILPSIEQQENFNFFVEHIKTTKLSIQQCIAKMEVLKKSLMQQYFG